MPAPGETTMGSEFFTIPGGKGANQAVAAARLGGEVHMVGRVGSDDFGERLMNGLNTAGVNTDHVKVTANVASGVAMILVDDSGENSIVVVGGANSRLTPDDVNAAEDLIARAACVVMQLEVPFETIRHALALCKRLGVYTILDPAPAPASGLPAEFYDVDILSPNQTEAELLLSENNRLASSHEPHHRDAKDVAGDLLERGPASVVLKLGGNGALVIDRSGSIEEVSGFQVQVVDTTAAGDAFTGALAVAHAEGKTGRDAVRFANAAGALACTAFGAQPALPTRAAVEQLL